MQLNSHVSVHLYVIYQKVLRELNPTKIGTRRKKKLQNLVDNVVRCLPCGDYPDYPTDSTQSIFLYVLK